MYIASFTDTYQEFTCADAHASALNIVSVLQARHEQFIYLEEYCLYSLNIQLIDPLSWKQFIEVFAYQI